MGRIKKLKGWSNEIFITRDEKLAALISRNTVYVYDLDTREIIFQTKTALSNTSEAVISKDRKVLAAKNTSGTLVIISMETGEEICRNAMAKTEGFKMTFAEDDRSVLDFDGDGRTMLLTQDGQYTILDGPEPKKRKESLPSVYLRYDTYTKQIYKFMYDHPDFNGNFVLISSAEKDHISYEVLRRIQGTFPNHIWGLSFCKEHIFYLVKDESTDKYSLIVCDRQFKQVDLIQLPLENIVKEGTSIWQMWVSPGEKYALIKPAVFMGNTYLLNLKTKELVREFDYPYVYGFTMVKDDTVFLISTWEGTYVGEL